MDSDYASRLIAALTPYVMVRGGISSDRRYRSRDRDTVEFRSWSDDQKLKRAAKKKERAARKKSR